MTSSSSSVEAIKHIKGTLFSAQGALKTLAPEYNWAGMGNLLGDYGELVCVQHYGLAKAPAGSSGFDAITHEGQTVQIKTCHASNQIGFRGQADLILVIKVETDGSWEEVYFGPFELVNHGSTYSKRDNKRTMTLSKLRGLAAS